MFSLLPLLIVAVLVALNGLFVAAEFAIIGAPRASIENRAAKGSRTASMVNRILHHPTQQDRYIATAQLGITFASLGLGMYGEQTIAQWLSALFTNLGFGGWLAVHSAATVIAVAILTYLHIVFGEMLPKSIALQRAGEMVLWVTPSMLGIQTLLYPLVVALNGAGNLLLSLAGIRRDYAASHFHTPEELEFVIQESQEGGMLRRESGDVLHGLFEFGDLTAGEVMVPRIKLTGISLGSGPQRMRDTILDSSHTRYPVYEEDLDHVVGMVHIKDILRLLLEKRSLALSDVRQVPHVPATIALDEALHTMQQQRTQILIVMDEYGGTAGIVTFEDIIEEVVGEIAEGEDIAEIFVGPDQELNVLGTVRLDQVGESLGLLLDHTEVDTVSGLVLMLLGRPAQIGDTVEYKSVRFQVAEIAGHGVSRCVITLLQDPSESVLTADKAES